MLQDKDLRVVVVTAERSMRAMQDKVSCLVDNFTNIKPENIIACVDKSLIHADYIVDDFFVTLDNCAPHMTTIKFNTRSNRDKHGFDYEVNNLIEAYRIIKKREESFKCTYTKL